MRFPCHPVDAGFFDNAPLRFVNTVELDAPPRDVFATLADPGTWPRWFPGMRSATWTSARTHAPGSARTVALAMLTLDEQFFRWQPDRRLSFFVTAQSQPLVHALAEDYLLDAVAANKTHFTYTVAMEPRVAIRLGGGVARAYFGSMFRKASQGLARYVAHPPTRTTSDALTH
ncbi:MAG: SRPBCC family protein [Burkholderiales bacterium]